MKAPESFDPLGEVSVRIRLARQFAMLLIASTLRVPLARSRRCCASGESLRTPGRIDADATRCCLYIPR
jgi:hypothetical protein